MLQKIRAKTHGLFAWIMILGIAFVFVLWGVAGYFDEQGAGNTIARVNGEPISLAELKLAQERLAKQQQLYQSMQGKQIPIDLAAVRKEALNALITERMFSKAAHAYGFVVGRTAVDQVLVGLPQFQVEGQFSPERFKLVLQSIGYTPDDFRVAVARDMAANQVQMSLEGSAFVGPQERDRMIQLLEQKRDWQYHIFKTADYEKGINISDKAIQEYYAAHPDDWMKPEAVQIEYVTLKRGDIKTIAEPTDAQLKAFYEANLSRYTQAEQRQASHILIAFPPQASDEDLKSTEKKINDIKDKLQKGANFAEMAKEFSMDPGSGKQGGDLGWFGRGQMVPEFDKAVFDATPQQVKAHEIVGPIRTQFGWHLIEVTGVRPEHVMSFADAKTSMVEAVKNDLLAENFAEKISTLEQLSEKNPDNLTVISNQMGLPIETSDFFGSDTQKQTGHAIAPTSLINHPEIVATAFSEPVLRGGLNSAVISFDPDTAVILRLKTHRPATPEPLETVRKEIETQLRMQAASDHAEQAGLALLKEVEAVDKSAVKSTDTSSEASHAKSVNIATAIPKQHWTQAEKVGRQDPNFAPMLREAAFRLAKPQPSDKHFSATGVLLDDGYAVIVLDAVYPGEVDPAERKVIEREYTNGLKQYEGNLVYQLYAVGIEEKTTVELFETE